MRDRIEACQRCHWWGQPWTSGQSGQAARPVAVWLASGGLVAWQHVREEQQLLAILLLASFRRQKNFRVLRYRLGGCMTEAFVGLWHWPIGRCVEY